MNIKRMHAFEERMLKINGIMYRFTRDIYFPGDGAYVDLFAHKWTGHTWLLVHHWGGRK
jgi:hypothetical protein